MNDRKYWIDGLKLIASIGVAIAHFYILFLQGSAVGMATVPLRIQNLFIRLGFIVNGSYWICVFGILSGYLIGLKCTSSFRNTLSDILLRYVRFALSFFITGIIIYIISLTVHFPTYQYAEIIGNEELYYYYQNPVSILDVIKMTFLFDSSIDGPLWMIGAIFWGNELSYILSYIKLRLGHIAYYILAILSIALTIYFAPFKPIFTYFIACIVGDLLGTISGKIQIKKHNAYILGIIAVALMYTFHNDIADSIFRLTGKMIFPYKHTYITLFYALMLVVFNMLTPIVNTIFSRMNPKLTAGISFPVYLIHVPIIYSFSLVIFGALIQHFSYTSVFFINMIITAMIVAVFSVLINIIEIKAVNPLIKRFKALLIAK